MDQFDRSEITKMFGATIPLRVPPNTGWVGHGAARNVGIRLPARAPLLLPCTVTRGFERQDPPPSGGANEILAVTRENVPENALYFLQHRWR
jgi:hypothetical protein